MTKSPSDHKPFTAVSYNSVIQEVKGQLEAQEEYKKRKCDLKNEYLELKKTLSMLKN